MQERNTHPFAQRGRLFAHNGVVHDLERAVGELAKLPVPPPVARPQGFHH